MELVVHHKPSRPQGRPREAKDRLTRPEWQILQTVKARSGEIVTDLESLIHSNTDIRPKLKGIHHKLDNLTESLKEAQVKGLCNNLTDDERLFLTNRALRIRSLWLRLPRDPNPEKMIMVASIILRLKALAKSLKLFTRGEGFDTLDLDQLREQGTQLAQADIQPSSRSLDSNIILQESQRIYEAIRKPSSSLNTKLQTADELCEKFITNLNSWTCEKLDSSHIAKACRNIRNSRLLLAQLSVTNSKVQPSSQMILEDSLVIIGKQLARLLRKMQFKDPQYLPIVAPKLEGQLNVDTKDELGDIKRAMKTPGAYRDLEDSLGIYIDLARIVPASLSRYIQGLNDQRTKVVSGIAAKSRSRNRDVSQESQLKDLQHKKSLLETALAELICLEGGHETIALDLGKQRFLKSSIQDILTGVRKIWSGPLPNSREQRKLKLYLEAITTKLKTSLEAAKNWTQVLATLVPKTTNLKKYLGWRNIATTGTGVGFASQLNNALSTTIKVAREHPLSSAAA